MTDLREQLQATLGPQYTLERELGGGGMSRVFVADDLTLGRQIVVKVLPAETSAGVSVERFKREIQTAARLQHPHIVPLLSAGETGGLPFYTMPFVKGDSLRARLTRGDALSVNETLHILHDIAAALSYAHAEGVVHRDIKPDNVIVSGGVAVVTDFGVAKAMDLANADQGGSSSGLTSFGVALGTPAYMSPEQASADPEVDHRADIYSFGCVAYEMLAGTSPFAGRSPQQMLAAHVHVVPEPVEQRRPHTAPALASLIMKCLEKRPADRPQSAHELLVALDAVAPPSGGAMPTTARIAVAGRSRAVWYAGALGVIAIGAALAVMKAGSSFTPYRVVRKSPVAVTPSMEMQPSISPNGQFVAFSGSTPRGFRIFVRQVEGGRLILLTDDLSGDHFWPQWKPDDGSQIVFEANGAAYMVAAFGGTPKRVIESAITPSWSPDGKQLAYADGQGLWVAPVDGGAPRLLVTGYNLHAPAWAPDMQHLAYVNGLRPDLSNISTNSVWVTSLSGEPGPGVRVSDSMHVNFSPGWVPDGKSLLFVSNMGGTFDVYQQALRANGNPVGAAVPVTTGAYTEVLSLSKDGSRLASDVVARHSNVWMATIGRDGVARMSTARQITLENETIEGLSLSRDGKWLAYDSNRSGNFDIYKLRLDGGEPQRITSTAANDFRPSWSPDGREIAFHRVKNENRIIYTVSAEGQNERAVSAEADVHREPFWSANGRQLFYVFRRLAADSESGIATVDLQADGTWSAQRIIARPHSIPRSKAKPSPDGKRIAFTDDGSLWVVDVAGGAPRRLADAVAFGGQARSLAWSNDPTVVYTMVFPNTASATNPGGAPAQNAVKIMAVPIAGGPPRLVMTSDESHPFYQSDFATDGRRIFFTVSASQSDVWVWELSK